VGVNADDHRVGVDPHPPDLRNDLAKVFFIGQNLDDGARSSLDRRS
jgi:hypothetical protein